jgi:hypothetical protein
MGIKPVTPDHIIRTKRVPLILDDDPAAAVRGYADAYTEYFRRHTDGRLTMIDPAPRWAVWRDRGILAFGPTVADANVVRDIAEHTVATIQWAEALGGAAARRSRRVRHRIGQRHRARGRTRAGAARRGGRRRGHQRPAERRPAARRQEPPV